MKPSKELYQRTFSRLKPSPEFGKELLTMTENMKRPKRFVARRLIAIAAVLALVFALAMGANAATGFFSPFLTMFSSLFGGESNQLELMEQLGRPIGVRDSKNGITISADALLSDGENAVVLYTVSRDDGKPLVSSEETRGDHLHFGLHGEGQGSIEHPIGLGSLGNKFLEFFDFFLFFLIGFFHLADKKLAGLIPEIIVAGIELDFAVVDIGGMGADLI